MIFVFIHFTNSCGSSGFTFPYTSVAQSIVGNIRRESIAWMNTLRTYLVRHLWHTIFNILWSETHSYTTNSVKGCIVNYCMFYLFHYLALVLFLLHVWCFKVSIPHWIVDISGFLKAGYGVCLCHRRAVWGLRAQTARTHVLSLKLTPCRPLKPRLWGRRDSSSSQTPVSPAANFAWVFGRCWVFYRSEGVYCGQMMKVVVLLGVLMAVVCQVSWDLLYLIDDKLQLHAFLCFWCCE